MVKALLIYVCHPLFSVYHSGKKNTSGNSTFYGMKPSPKYVKGKLKVYSCDILRKQNTDLCEHTL